MKRVFEMLAHPHWKGERKLIVFLTACAVVRRILDHRRIDSEPPVHSSA